MNKVSFIIVIILFLVIPSAFPQGQEIAALMKEGDALWLQCRDSERAPKTIALYEKVLKLDPDHYEALWKIARSYFIIGDALPETEEFKNRHKECGEMGMSYGKRAVTVHPQGVEGHYYYGLSIAQYSIGISIVKALIKGLGPEYEKHIGRAISIDKLYDYAGPLRAMGRYWYRLPWPKRNIDKSIDYLKEAETIAPLSTRGHVYLAESYLKSGEKGLARKQLKTAIDMEQGLYKECDAMRWRERAEKLLKEHF